MRRALFTLAIWTLAFGCEIRKHKYEDEPPAKDPATAPPRMPATTLTPEQLSELRAAVIASSTLLDRPELTPTDPAIIDRFVIESLEEGAFPSTPKQREDHLWHARVGLQNWLSYKEDGLAYLEKRIEERYAKPVITRDGDLVRIDAGVVPDKLGVFKARLQVRSSPLIVRGELVASESRAFSHSGWPSNPTPRPIRSRSTSRPPGPGACGPTAMIARRTRSGCTQLTGPTNTMSPESLAERRLRDLALSHGPAHQARGPTPDPVD